MVSDCALSEKGNNKTAMATMDNFIGIPVIITIPKNFDEISSVKFAAKVSKLCHLPNSYSVPFSCFATSVID